MTIDLSGLPRWEWRLYGKGDGVMVPQRRVKEEVVCDYWKPDSQDPRKLAAVLVAFADSHDEAKVTIEHDFEGDPRYSCETKLELDGWRTVDEDEVKREQASAKRKEKADRAAEARILRERLEKLES